MRRLLIGGALGALVVSLAACGNSSSSSSSEQATQIQLDRYAIGEIEKNFHKATSKHDIELMMSLWAPNATFTVGPGHTVTGKTEIREVWLKESKAFKATTSWVSDTPAYKLQITVNGDKGTLNFQCHYVDVKTGEVQVITAADQEVARMNGKWLITSMVGGSATLSP